MIRFDEQYLRDRLAYLNGRHRTLFGLSCAERLFPLYELFAARSGQGAPDSLRSTLNELWQSTLTGTAIGEHPFLRQYESLIPEDETETNKRPLLGPLAEDAVAALAYACQCRV